MTSCINYNKLFSREYYEGGTVNLKKYFLLKINKLIEAWIKIKINIFIEFLYKRGEEN